MSQKASALRIEYVLTGVVLILLVITLAVIWSPTAPTLPPPPVSATRLVIVAPSTARVGQGVQLKIQAVDPLGRLDSRRTDVVKVSMEPNGLVSLSDTTVTLQDGEGVLTGVGLRVGIVTITVSWVEGYGSLDPGSTTITVQT